MSIRLLASSLLVTSSVAAQMAPTNDKPNPYTTVEAWAKFSAAVRLQFIWIRPRRKGLVIVCWYLVIVCSNEYGLHSGCRCLRVLTLTVQAQHGYAEYGETMAPISQVLLKCRFA